MYTYVYQIHPHIMFINKSSKISLLISFLFLKDAIPSVRVLDNWDRHQALLQLILQSLIAVTTYAIF